MIGLIRGKLAHKEPPFLIIDVNGVGYEMEVPMSTLFQLPQIGAEVLLRTHLISRDDNQTLYGFMSEEERQLFRSLLKVNGVGAKLALTILSGMSASDFKACVRNEDKTALVKLPGVGRKTAERLIIDMRDRIDAGSNGAANGATVTPGASSEPRTEAFNALVSLGYKPGEAQKMLDNAAVEASTTEDILRSVLRAVAS